MEREFVYIDLEDGKKAILAGKDGYPTFVESVEDETGGVRKAEKTLDVFHLLDKVPELSTDLKKFKEESRSMKDLVSAFKQKNILSDDDFSSGEASKKLNDWIGNALDAQEKVKLFNDKDIAKIKNFDEMKSQIEKTRDEKLNEQKKFYDNQLSEKGSIIDRQKSQINKLMISDKFATSKFIKENCSHIPVSVLANTFSRNFKLHEDEGDWSVVGFKTDGKPIFSTIRPLENASFDEAIEVMIKEHPDKDYFFGGVVGNGSGGQAGKTGTSSLEGELERAVKSGNTVEQVRLKKLIKDKQNKR